MAKIKETARVISQEKLADGVYSMWIDSPAIASQAVQGQFIYLYCRDGARLLPRPISLCEINREEGSLRLVYRIAGAGTREFSALKEGDWLEVLGPLGNGFPMEEME